MKLNIRDPVVRAPCPNCIPCSFVDLGTAVMLEGLSVMTSNDLVFLTLMDRPAVEERSARSLSFLCILKRPGLVKQHHRPNRSLSNAP